MATINKEREMRVGVDRIVGFAKQSVYLKWSEGDRIFQVKLHKERAIAPILQQKRSPQSIRHFYN
jgi:hypothetical protein